jgi:peroxiredoxin-like protein
MAEHRFQYHADWPGGRNAVGDMRCGALASKISIATGMGGPGVGTNPDEMLLGAAATCYLMTLAAIIERAHIEIAGLTLDSHIVVDVTGGVYACKEIVHAPHITLAPGTTPAARAELERFTQTAAAHCMVSKALRGNVDIRVEAVLQPVA